MTLPKNRLCKSTNPEVSVGPAQKREAVPSGRWMRGPGDRCAARTGRLYPCPPIPPRTRFSVFWSVKTGNMFFEDFVAASESDHDPVAWDTTWARGLLHVRRLFTQVLHSARTRPIILALSLASAIFEKSILAPGEETPLFL